MGLNRTDEFRKDAVRIALTSGLTRKQVADDLGVRMSTLNKWITAHPTAQAVGAVRRMQPVSVPKRSQSVRLRRGRATRRERRHGSA
jgi:transposase